MLRYKISKLRIRLRCLTEVVIDFGWYVLANSIRLLARFMLRLYDKDGTFKYNIVQAGYGRRDLTEVIDWFSEAIEGIKIDIKTELKKAFAH